MVLSVKLPILKNGEYILWTIKMEQYLAHTDYAMWEVILNGNSAVQMSKDEAGNEIKVSPVTAQQILARTRERKAKSTMLMAIPDEHLARFHGIKDAKTLWAAIKTRFCGNTESKKMQKNVLKQQFEIFFVSNSGSRQRALLEHPQTHRIWIFIFAKSTSNTNELNAAYSVSTTTSHSSQAQGSSSYADELMFSFFANQSSTPQLDNEDLEQIDQDDLEEIDLKWQVAMLSIRVKRFYKKTRRKLEFNGKELVGFDKNKVECFNCHRRGHFARDCRSTKNSRNRSRDAGNAGYKGRDNEEEETNFAFMPFTSNPSSSSSSNSELDEALKEKQDLKAKLEKFKTSLKNLTKLLDSQISAKVKTGLGYDSQFNEKEVLDIKKEEVTKNAFDNRSSDEENSVANDRFKKGEGYHAVPPPLTGNYMPPKPDLSFARLDDSIYKFKISKIVTSLARDEKNALETSTAFVEKPKEDRFSALLIEDWKTDSDNDSVFTPKPIPIKIDFVKAGDFINHVKPIEFVKHVKPITPVKNAEQTEKSKNFSSSPKVDRKNWNGKMTQKLMLGFGFTKKACFVCGSLSHLIKDCTFHEDRMAKKSMLPTNVGKETSHMESRPIWNNVQRINHHNNFAPTTLFTRSGRIPVSAAKPKAAASTSAAKPVNTAGPKQSVNFSRTTSTFHKSHSPIKRSFYKATTHSRINSTERVNTAGSKVVSVVKGNRVTAAKTLAANPQLTRATLLHHRSTSSHIHHLITFTESPPTAAAIPTTTPSRPTSSQNPSPSILSPRHHLLLTLPHHQSSSPPPSYKIRGVWFRCNTPRHIFDATHFWGCYKAYLADYQEIQDGGFVAFGSSRGKITGKVTDDFSRFSWVFFLATKDETSKVLKPFITTIENQINKKVKFIRCDNETEFKNKDLDELCGMKGLKREYSNATTLQQNRVAERKNKTLIKAARTMLADSLLPITFWAEAVNTTCYVLNRALVTKTQNKSPYELLNGKTPRLDFMRPFGCPVTILNTLDPLGKFKGKANEGFLAGTMSLVKLSGYLILKQEKLKRICMLVSVGNQTDKNASPQDTNGNADDKPADDKPKDDIGSKTVEEPVNKDDQAYRDELDRLMINVASTSGTFSAGGPSSPHPVQSVGAEDDFNNIESSTIVSLIPTHKVHIDHPKDQILRDPKSTVQTRGMVKKNSGAHALMEPKKVSQALDDESWVEAMQEELLQFSLQEVWRLVDLPYGKKAIGTKWVYKNKKDKKGIVVRNRARLIPNKFHGGAYILLRTAASTPIETKKPMVKDEVAADVDVHLYKSMIGSLMYLTASRPDIMFAVYACSRFQVTPKHSHLQAVKRIFRYLKGQPKLGLWYPRDSPFDLKAYSDSDYAGANLDRKSTTGGFVDSESAARLWFQLPEYQNRH
uniref:Putative ribonuclease H-like domain-containing protein n=1 Tax=Tanacetum cinerariifolium TaxID=118510 RepID=A0A6L2JD01_TANCI|nr:putative ribonuclease H-like domain-containing protein [Tanacetum cinerariifolium]